MPTIRPAVRADLPQLVDTYNHYIEHTVATFDPDPVTVADRSAWFETFADTGPHRLLVACDGEQVLGCASSGPYRTHAAFARTVEFGIYLDPGVRARGIGSALYSALLDALHGEPVHVAVAGIALPNEASVALHRKFGFAPIGVFEEYAFKGGAYISSLWMQRRLSAGSGT